jgi:hypothetical protein
MGDGDLAMPVAVIEPTKCGSLLGPDAVCAYRDLTSEFIETVPRLFPFSVVVEMAVATDRTRDQWYGHVGLRASAEVRTIGTPGDER